MDEALKTKETKGSSLAKDAKKFVDKEKKKANNRMVSTVSIS